ncbi:SPFH domain-containing protein [Paenibacillus ferrarius]|uniref:SPFH domain-containing protein n=1 Tax=Paenibacillus ferrarius TaxID=1469647 RepID=UPI003D289223
MAIIDLVKYNGPPLALAWKYPNEELSTWTQLIVNESQEALFVKGGQALDLFGPGRHTLSSQNIPLLSSIINLPFGGKSPYTAEIWFVNKAHTLDIKWGTPSPIQLQDPKYQLPVSVRAFGQFGVQIENTRKFLVKINGTLPVFDQATLVKHFSGVLLMNVNKLISGYLVHNKISILDINAYVEDISKHMEQAIGPVFEEYGIRLANFNVVSINIPDNDNVTQRLKDALAKRAEMDILGFTYQQERTFNTLEGAASKNGVGSSIMDAGLGAAMGIGIGGPIGQNLAQLTNQLTVQDETRACPKCQAANKADARFCYSCGSSFQSGAPIAEKVTCDNCGKPVDPNSKFCSHCGDAVRPCPTCKADNPQHARACVKCGTALSMPCPQCGHVLAPGAKFCPECGVHVGLPQCGQCKTDVQPGQKFCLECGNKLS